MMYFYRNVKVLKMDIVIYLKKLIGIFLDKYMYIFLIVNMNV